jgi:hypothetical protein
MMPTLSISLYPSTTFPYATHIPYIYHLLLPPMIESGYGNPQIYYHTYFVSHHYLCPIHSQIYLYLLFSQMAILKNDKLRLPSIYLS